MKEARYVYLTLPEPTAYPIILNVTVGTDRSQFRVTRKQLFDLNAQIADILAKGGIAIEHAFDEQLALNLG